MTQTFEAEYRQYSLSQPYGVAARPLRKRAWYSIGKVIVVLLIAFVLLVVLAAPLTFG
ncbi:MAG: hypothetical protein IPK87_06230 [Planctomycetes bacterium]|nr:hypothetical protein [Planctomycetota bacterium]